MHGRTLTIRTRVLLLVLAAVTITASACVLLANLQARVFADGGWFATVSAPTGGAARDLASHLAIALVLASLFALATLRLTAPLAALSALLAHPGDVEAAIAPHLSAQDEIGQIARAVHRLVADLMESTAHVDAIYRNAPVGIVSCDETGKILDMNPEAETLFGFAPGSAIGRSIDILMPDECRGRHGPRLVAFGNNKGAMTGGRDVSGLRQDGTLFSLSVTLGNVRVGDRKTIVGILQDVTERHDAEERLAALLHELEASKAELERSNIELDRFAYIASHDLKAPLRVIDNAAAWLSEDLDAFLTEDTRDSMNLLRGRVRRMERFLDDLLAYSRVGRAVHGGAAISGTVLMQEVVSLVSPPPGFRITLGPGFDEVRLPGTPISGVLLNLISNAIKHHDRAEGLVHVTVEDQGAQLAFAVSDDGPGIPAEHQERVFEMFQTLKPRDEVEGSGMGLAFARKTVESMNGALTLTSGDGRGCVFRFTWPKCTQQKDALA